MPDVCRAYDAYEAYEVWKRFFREDGGRERLSTHGVRTPSTDCGKRTPSTVCGRSPSLEEGGLGGGESGVGRMSAEIATVRCVCNAGLHHCNGWKHLQPSVASPNHVGARIARPFIPDVITTLREGARRVIGATAKPLYPIDGKAGGHDRRNHRPPSLREGDRPQAVEGVDALR